MHPSLSDQAYEEIRRLIVRLDLPPGAILREGDLRQRLGIGRTPIREALQRLARQQFVTVVPRRGMFVSGIEVNELSLLYETRAVLEPYAARLAAERGTGDHWAAMESALAEASRAGTDEALLAVDRSCHEILWEAADNRFLLDSLDTLYAQSDRLWHLHLAEVADMSHTVAEHVDIFDALRSGDADRAATLVEAHVRAFDEQIRRALSAVDELSERRCL